MIRNSTALIFLFVLSGAAVSAQGTTDVGAGNQFKYTDVLQPSPDLAKLNTFSRPDVGMASGTAQFHLPLTSIDVGGVTVPISVSYSSNGVKVDELSSRVGTDFHLETGGSINRVISGKDDTMYPYLAPPSVSVADTSFLHYLERVLGLPGVTGQIFDSQPDVYSYNFCGMSGKFVIDRHQNVIQIPKSKNKITMTNYGSNTNWSITVTDTQGNQFIFGGTGGIEISKSTNSCGRSYANPTPTAWFLKQIVTYLGDTMDFTYQPVTFTYDRGVNQSIYYQTQEQLHLPPASGCTCPVYSQSVNSCINYYNAATWYPTVIISSRGERIDLTWAARADADDMLLKNVKKTNSYSGVTLENYKLAYTTVHTTLNKPTGIGTIDTKNEYRYFLKSVNKYAGAGDTIPMYRMKYNHPELLPVRLSFSQDDWGYFNGKNNNTLLPVPTDIQRQGYFPQANADRSIDTVACKYGLLTSIQYATGGFDSMVYDVNRFYETRQIYPKLTPFTLYQAGLPGAPDPDVSSNMYFTTYFGQQVYFSLTVTNKAAKPPIHGTEGFLYVLNSSGAQVEAIGLFPGSDDDYGYDANSTFSESKTLPPDTYHFYLAVNGEIATADALVNAYIDPIRDSTANYAVGGVRVNSILHYTLDKQRVGMSRYAYHEMNSSLSSAVKSYTIDYAKSISFDVYCTVQPSEGGQSPLFSVLGHCDYSGMLSSPAATVMSQEGSSVFYPTVLEFSDADGTNGVTEHKFQFMDDAPGVFILGSSVIQSNLSNRSVLNHGKELHTTHYGKNGTGFYPLKKTDNYYSAVNTRVFTNIVANAMFFGSGQNATTSYVNVIELAPFEATRYDILAPLLGLDSVVETDYTSGGGTYIKSVAYLMDTVYTNQTKSIITKDSRGRIQETLNYYSGMGSLPGVTSTSPQGLLMGSLITQNKLSQLLYQRTNVNGAFAGSQRVTLFTPSPSNRILAQDIRQYFADESNGIGFTILSYDANGNITSRKKDDGTVESLIWDYQNRYPVAQVIGSDLSQIAYTGCEQSSFGGWTVVNGGFVADVTAPAGANVCSFSSAGTISKAGLTAAAVYTVSYWYKTGTTVSVTGASSTITFPGKDGWTNAVATLTGVTTATINVSTGGRVDDMRLHPANAKMSTYTYLPGIGVSSVSDANNKITYYTYDGHNRLITVRDYRGKILKSNQYHNSTATTGSNN